MFNPIRDTVFCGNQKMYDLWGTASSMVLGGTAALGAKTAGTSITKAVVTEVGKEVVLDYATGKTIDFVGDKYNISESVKVAMNLGLGAGVGWKMNKTKTQDGVNIQDNINTQNKVNIQNEIRERVLKNIEESELDSESPGFKKITENVLNDKEIVTEADRMKQFNINNCREQMTNTLKNYRKELIDNKDAKDISKISSTADLGDLNLRGEAGSGIWKYNPTIKDYTGVDPRKFCKTTEDYTKYYRNLLSDKYLESLPDSFWNGKNKAIIKEDMAKLRADIERVKKEAEDLGEYNVHGEPSFEYKWNVDNCAEVWSSRDAILKGARYDDLVYRTENLNGGFAEPCDNCQRTFKGKYNID